ncbi:hypothetical protein KCV07_g9855, partial [Aureobasidium melanogenum]
MTHWVGWGGPSPWNIVPQHDCIIGRKPQPIEGVTWKTSLESLLSTCKTFYYEAASILYGTTSFYFDDAQRLRAFLRTVSDRNLACITTLRIHVRTYGVPNEANNIRWEQKHIKRWTKKYVIEHLFPPPNNEQKRRRSGDESDPIALYQKSMPPLHQRLGAPCLIERDFSKRAGDWGEAQDCNARDDASRRQSVLLLPIEWLSEAFGFA